MLQWLFTFVNKAMFTFVKTPECMTIPAWYKNNFEDRLSGRYITPKMMAPILEKHTSSFDVSVAGYSELGVEIPLVKIGSGSKKILAWSQMHGNETTTTKAVFDFLKLLTEKKYFQEELVSWHSEYTLYLLPMLNPDGAKAYIRENSNGIDLNRDAQARSQSESLVLRDVFNVVSPHLCLNLHDQRTLFGTHTRKPATISFLAPAANSERSVTPARRSAMDFIEKMNRSLQELIPGQVGRYDDSFNLNCVGDTFQAENVPTILFEAGHYKNDYTREKTREYIFYALCSLFDLCKSDSDAVMRYAEIPENRKNFRDIILKNVRLDVKKAPFGTIAIQYKETLVNDKIVFTPVIDSIGEISDMIGHTEIDVKNHAILINSQEKYHVGQEVLNIIGDNQDSTVYFSV